jgi:hypothetical protein
VRKRRREGIDRIENVPSKLTPRFS